MDAALFKNVVLTPACTIIFYFLLFLLFRYLFRKMRGEEPVREEDQTKHVRYDVWIALAVYCFCTIVFFFPIFSSIGTSLIGPPEDNMQFFWNKWWIYKALTDPALRPAFSEYIFYPEGASLLYQDSCWYDFLLFLALRPFLAPVILHNLLILNTFVFSGIAAFLLIRYLTRSSWASLAGGFIFAFSPARFARSLHHQNS